MSDNKQIVMEIPKEIIDAQVKAAVVGALAKDPEKLVAAVVDAAMRQKDPRDYGRTTIWDRTINDAIRLAANEAMKEWLDGQRAAIKAAVLSRLKRKEKLIGEIADKLIDKFSSRFDLHISVSEER